jgi:hypothetical protein
MVHYLPKTGRLLHPHIGWEVSEARRLASVPLLSISVKYRKIATVGGLVSLSLRLFLFWWQANNPATEKRNVPIR